MTIWGGVNRFLVKTHGAILIEFAFCVPVLFILILYIYDATLMSRYYKQTEQVACQVINMLQNVSQKRNDKRIIKTDLQNILIAAYLTIYPDTAFSSLAGSHKYGHFLRYLCIM